MAEKHDIEEQFQHEGDEILLPNADEQIAALARVDDRHLQIMDALDWLKDGESGDKLEAIQFVETQMKQYREELENAYVLVGGVKQVAEAFKEQRDEAVHDLEELESAIENHNYYHPIVAQFKEDIEQQVTDAINSGWWDEPMEPEEQYEVALENAASTILMMTKTSYSPENFDRAKKIAFAFFSSQYGDHNEFATDDLDVQNAFVILMNKALANEPKKSEE